jgi:hypothetical protein
MTGRLMYPDAMRTAEVQLTMETSPPTVVVGLSPFRLEGPLTRAIIGHRRGRATMIDMRTVLIRPAVSIQAANLLGSSLSATAVLANDPAPGQVQEIGSKSAGISSKQSGSAKSLVRKSTRKPDGAGNFVYGIINTIRAQSEELCARYGNPSDCLEEAEVGLTVRDADDNQVRLCLNTAPGDGKSGRGTVQKSRLRR